MMNFGRGGKDALTTVLRPLGINVSDTDSYGSSSDTGLDSSSSSSLDDAPLQHILSRLYSMDPVRTSVVGEKRVSDRRPPREVDGKNGPNFHIQAQFSTGTTTTQKFESQII
jgi:hypothetical protein